MTEMDTTENQSVQNTSHLLHLARLPESAELSKRVNALQAEAASPALTPRSRQDIEDRLKLAIRQEAWGQERDAIQAVRPERCRCLGMGIYREYGKGGFEFKERLCVCREGEAERTRREVLARVSERRAIDAVWQAAEIPLRFAECRLASHPGLLNAPELRSALWPNTDGWVDEDWGKAPDLPTRSWYIWGKPGVGKTGLAVAYAYAYADFRGGKYSDRVDDHKVLFRSLPRLLSELRATYGKANDGPSEDSLLERYRNVGLLVLDDLGAEAIGNADWMRDRIYQVVGERHDEMRPIVFTSNWPLDQMAARLGERITWRILEMCGKDNIIELKGRNLRQS